MEIENFKQTLTQWFNYYRKKFRIRETWEVKVSIKPLKGEYAVVDYWFKDRIFHVFVDEKKNINEEDLRDTLIHEFLHIILSPFTDKMDDYLEEIKAGKKPNPTKWKRTLEQYEERTVIKLTKIIYQFEDDRQKAKRKIQNLRDRR